MVLGAAMTAFNCSLGLIRDFIDYFFIDLKINGGGKTLQRPHSSRHDMILSEVTWSVPLCPCVFRYDPVVEEKC